MCMHSDRSELCLCERTVHGNRKIVGRTNRRNGIDAAGYLQYYDRERHCGNVLVMGPCEVTDDTILCSAKAHVDPSWTDCYIVDKKDC